MPLVQASSSYIPVAMAKGSISWRFRVSSDKPALLDLLLLLTMCMPPRKWYLIITDWTVNKSTSDSMARVTAGDYN